MDTFGRRLAYLRKQHGGITQQDLSDATGLSVSLIGMYERDKRLPNSKSLKKLSEYFRVTTDYLLGISKYPKGRVVKDEELKLIAPEVDLVDLGIKIFIDDAPMKVGEETRADIRRILKDHGYLP